METKKFTNIWRPRDLKDWFFNVDVCEEVTRRISKDADFDLGRIANVSVDLRTGKPYILRNSEGPGKIEYEIANPVKVRALFTTEELEELATLADEVRRYKK